jgi:hypothetical protein
LAKIEEVKQTNAMFDVTLMLLWMLMKLDHTPTLSA